MGDASRRITVTKRVSLAQFGEGWDDCYAIVTPANYATYDAISKADIEKMTNAERIMFEMDTVKRHFVSGKIKALNDKGTFELTDMLPGDIEASLELTEALYIAIMGLQLDPKGSSGEAPTGQPPANSESTTETSSSEA